jgi:hypothetical protein
LWGSTPMIKAVLRSVLLVVRVTVGMPTSRSRRAEPVLC